MLQKWMSLTEEDRQILTVQFLRANPCWVEFAGSDNDWDYLDILDCEALMISQELTARQGM